LPAFFRVGIPSCKRDMGRGTFQAPTTPYHTRLGIPFTLPRVQVAPRATHPSSPVCLPHTAAVPSSLRGILWPCDAGGYTPRQTAPFRLNSTRLHFSTRTGSIMGGNSTVLPQHPHYLPRHRRRHTCQRGGTYAPHQKSMNSGTRGYSRAGRLPTSSRAVGDYDVRLLFHCTPRTGAAVGPAGAVIAERR